MSERGQDAQDTSFREILSESIPAVAVRMINTQAEAGAVCMQRMGWIKGPLRRQRHWNQMWKRSPPPGSWPGYWIEDNALAKGEGKGWSGGDVTCFRHRSTDLSIENPGKKPQEAMDCTVLKIIPRTEYLPRMLRRCSCLGSQCQAGT